MRIVALLAATASFATAAPNVLFIAVDDLRPDLGAYGAAHMRTPHMDALAASGRLFRNHYVAVPTCGASRYALMTGLRPTAATDNNDAFDLMPTTAGANPESWVDLLRRNGWHTASIGKITHEPDGYRWNFPSVYDIGRSQATVPDMRFSWDEIIWDHNQWGAQRYPLFAYADGTGRVSGVTPAFEIGVAPDGSSLPDDAYPDGQIAEAAIDKLREFAEEDTQFCLAVGFFKPHLPFNAPKAYFDLYNPATLPAPNPIAKPAGANSSTTGQSGEIGSYSSIANRAQLRHAYFACVSYVDAQIGKLLAALDQTGQASNTIVILWGDHGWCLDDYTLMGKHVVLEHGVESPLIIRTPASLGGDPFAGVPTEGIVETLDIYPTLAELCGVTPPGSAVGTSLVPLLRNPMAPGKDHAYSRFGSITTIRTGAWRLIQSGGDNDLYDLSTQRYETADVSAANPDTVAALAPQLSVQASRSGTTTYSSWAGNNPALADPNGNADNDRSNNFAEYLSGSDPLDPGDAPETRFSFRDLTATGLGSNEPVFDFTIRGGADDIRFFPRASHDLIDWLAPLAFLESETLGAGLHRFHFRALQPSGSTFFNLLASPD
jgi:arylsulfatase A-like enzyme